jgi:hypothetical protein
VRVKTHSFCKTIVVDPITRVTYIYVNTYAMSVYVVYQFYDVVTTSESNTDYTRSHENIDTNNRATSQYSESVAAIVHASPNTQKGPTT